MSGLKGGARKYMSDTQSLDSTGSASMSSLGMPIDLHPGGPFDNQAYTPSVAASRNTLATDVTEDSRKQLYGVDENEERGNWTGRFDFLLSLLGYAVGLGNVWRFPYLCYRNGGGAFLIPFAIMMLIVGVPLFFMEASIGQFTSRGPMTCWDFAPVFKGLGMSMVVGAGLTCTYYNMVLAWAFYYMFASFTSKLPWTDCYNKWNSKWVGISMVVVSAMTAMYYNMVLAWALYYMFASFTSKLPWTDCYNKWNSEYCSQKLPLIPCDDGTKYENGTCYVEDKLVGTWNDTLLKEQTGIKRVSPAEEYWNNVALQLSPGIEVYEQPHWYLVLCLMLAWIIVFFCLIKGIKSTGKVVYFTAIFPYVVLLILFFRGVTLENAGEGIKFFIIPVWSKLLEARVWKDAAVQIFFSMSIAGGGLITLSSYNRFHNNILKDTVIVCLGDFFTCIFAGFVIFSYLGFMAGKQGTTVDKVAQDGAGLAFVVYPEAVTNLPGPPFWSFLFFFMLITLGLDSQFAMVETVLTGSMDQFPQLRQYKTFVVLAICAFFFILGLPLTCSGGMYLLQLMDNYVGGWTLLIIGFAENMAISYAYGVPRFCKDLEVMLGFRINIYFKICWYAVSPLAVLFIFVFTFVDYTPSTYGDYHYPAWADAVGWILACLVISPMVIFFFYKLSKEDEEDGPLGKLKLLITPSRAWGPFLVKHRQLIDHVDGFVVDPYEERQATCGFSKYADINRSQSIPSITGSKASINRSMVKVSNVKLSSSKMSISNISGAVSLDFSLASQRSKQSRVTVESTV